MPFYTVDEAERFRIIVSASTAEFNNIRKEIESRASRTISALLEYGGMMSYEFDDALGVQKILRDNGYYQASFIEVLAESQGKLKTGVLR